MKTKENRDKSRKNKEATSKSRRNAIAIVFRCQIPCFCRWDDEKLCLNYVYNDVCAMFCDLRRRFQLRHEFYTALHDQTTGFTWFPRTCVNFMDFLEHTCPMLNFGEKSPIFSGNGPKKHRFRAAGTQNCMPGNSRASHKPTDGAPPRKPEIPKNRSEPHSVCFF